MIERKATNITRHEGHVSRAVRETLLGQKGCTIWLTGLPSSGKSTTAFTLEHELVQEGHIAYVLDGDNIRFGLNRNLGFSPNDRAENIRRIGEVALLYADTGIIAITSFISPYREDRDLVRERHNDLGIPFIEIFIDAPLNVCEERDPKGLFKKARQGELKDFTGIDAPYEKPIVPDMVLNTEQLTPEQTAEQIIEYLHSQALLPKAVDRALA